MGTVGCLFSVYERVVIRKSLRVHTLISPHESSSRGTHPPYKVTARHGRLCAHPLTGILGADKRQRPGIVLASHVGLVPRHWRDFSGNGSWLGTSSWVRAAVSAEDRQDGARLLHPPSLQPQTPPADDHSLPPCLLRRARRRHTLACSPSTPSSPLTPPPPQKMFASAARRSLTGLIPPKIATPGAVVRFVVCLARTPGAPDNSEVLTSQSSGTTSARTQAVIDFYSKLPKGPATEVSGGLRGRYFEGKNASGLVLRRRREGRDV